MCLTTTQHNCGNSPRWRHSRLNAGQRYYKKQRTGACSALIQIYRFLRLQPIFPYFLRNRLDTADLSPLRTAVETAFRLHYDELGAVLYDLLESKEPQKRQVGQVLTSLEYTNLSTALDLALAAQVSIISLYHTLSTYLDSLMTSSAGWFWASLS